MAGKTLGVADSEPTFDALTVTGDAAIGNADGDLVSFHGVTPAVRPTSASQAAVATDAATTGAATYGFTSAQANGIVTLLNRLRADLVTTGLIKGS